MRTLFVRLQLSISDPPQIGPSVTLSQLMANLRRRFGQIPLVLEATLVLKLPPSAISAPPRRPKYIKSLGPVQVPTWDIGYV